MYKGKSVVNLHDDEAYADPPKKGAKMKKMAKGMGKSCPPKKSGKMKK